MFRSLDVAELRISDLSAPTGFVGYVAGFVFYMMQGT